MMEEENKKLIEKRRQNLLDSLTTGFISGGVILLSSFMGDVFHYKYGVTYWYYVPVFIAFGVFFLIRYLIKTMK